MSLRRRLLRLTQLTSIGASAAFLHHLYKNDFDARHLGLVRVGRAGVAAVSVAVDYKQTFIRHSSMDSESEEWRRIKSGVHQRSADRLLAMCCANGGAFIKVGQHIGALEYLLPPEYVQTFKVLHSRAPQSSLEDLMTVIREEFGREPEDIFLSFDPQPLGTASLAQVHRATLKDGREVAMKIQHPRVKQRSAVDIATMEFLVGCLCIVFPEFEFKWLAEETRKNLPKELDFLHEGKNSEKLSNLLNDVPFLKIPRIHWDISTDRVLAMEYCPGGQVDDKEYMKKHNIPVQNITNMLGEIYSKMIFTHGFVHCDPHPGNVLVHRDKKDGDKLQIILLDHGLYQTLTDDFRISYCKLWLALINGNVEEIKLESSLLGAADMYGLLACMVAGRSWDSIQGGVGTSSKSSQEIEEIADYAGKLVVDISKLLNKVPRQLLLLFKTNDLLRGIEASLSSPPSSSSFLNMSRVCLRAVDEDWKKLNCGYTHWIRTTAKTHWELTKISAYEWILWWKGS